MRAALKTLGVVLIVLIGGALAVLYFADFNSYRHVITDKLSETVGRRVRIDGAVRVRFGRGLHLVVDDVGLANPPWGSRPEMVEAERVVVSLSLVSLLQGQVDIISVVVEGADVLVEKDSSGAGNWQIDRPRSDAAGEPRGGGSPPRIERLEVRDSRLAYRAANADPPSVLQVERLELRSFTAGASPKFAATVAMDGARLVASGDASPIATWLSEKASPELRGQVELQAEKPSSVAATLGIELPQRFPAVTLSGHLSLTRQALEADAIDARLGGSDLSGQLSLSRAEDRPRVKAALRSDRLDLGELFPGGSERLVADSENRSGDAAPLPWRSLSLANLDVSIEVESLGLHTGGDLDGVLLQVRLEDGELASRWHTTRGGQENVSVELAADQESERVDLGIRAREIPMENLFGHGTVRQAKATADIRLSGVGSSIEAARRTLAGEIRIDVGRGTFSEPFLDRISGDIVGQLIDLVNPLDWKSGPTQFICGVVRGKVDKGIIEFPTGLAMETENVRILGAGSVDATTTEIDLAFRSDPKGVTGISVTSVVDKLIRLRGTLADPKVRIDPMGTAGAAIRVGGAVMTGGLSLLGEGLLRYDPDDHSPCQIAKGLTPKKKSVAGEVADSARTVGDAVGKGLGAAGAGLKRLLR